jgi:hypothetical protein
LLGQRQRERQRRLERLPAGQRPHPAAQTRVVVVHDEELALVVDQVVLAAGQLAEDP